MSATLGSLISQLQPDWSIRVYERLGEVAQESSNAWNNAGTGHAALCELNYMPENPDGTVSAAKAIAINEQFQVSRQYWSYLVSIGALPEPHNFINSAPHMTFVKGAGEHRVPQEARRGAEGRAALRRPRVHRRPRAHRRVDPAAREEAQPEAEGRRDARRVGHRRRLRRTHEVPPPRHRTPRRPRSRRTTRSPGSSARKTARGSSTCATSSATPRRS